MSEWTVVHHSEAQQTDRMRIPGGWLYRTTWFEVVRGRLRASVTALVIQPERAE
jgi:hypothetical protein